jgi:hypothetical protein
VTQQSELAAGDRLLPLPSARRKTILVVEDNELNMKLFHDLLRIPMKSPLRTEMIAPLDSDMMSPPGTGAALAVGLLAPSQCRRQSSFRFS